MDVHEPIPAGLPPVGTSRDSSEPHLEVSEDRPCRLRTVRSTRQTFESYDDPRIVYRTQLKSLILAQIERWRYG